MMSYTTAIASSQQMSINQTSSQGGSVRQTSIQTNSSQTSEIAITLDSAKVRQPIILSVTPPKGTQLVGEITVNGEVVEEIKNKRVSLNLSRFLGQGKQAIKISGYYRPVESSIKVELLDSDTQISQAIGGNGKLSQTLIIHVQ